MHLDRTRFGGTEACWYALLQMFPGTAFVIGLATLSALLFS